MIQIHLYKWITLSILFVIVLSSCGNDKAEEIDDYATDTSIAVTGNPSAITPVSAEIVCKANITQGAASYEIGVLYSTDSEELSDFSGKKIKTKDLVGNAYKVTLTSLQPNTTYYYRSYVTTGGINNYGKIKSFITQSVSNPSTLHADTITAFSAYLHAKREITKDYAYEIGFSCIDGFVIADKKDSIEYKGRSISSGYNNDYKSFQNGNYRIIVNGLQPQTTYYFKAFSKINGGYTYGALKSFTTGVFEKPSISTPTDITTTSASVIVTTNNLYGYTVNSIGVIYATDATKLETSYNTATSNTNTGTQHPVSLSGLIPNTTYYMRPFIRVNTGQQIQIVYGETITFRTANFPAPTSFVNEVTYNRVSITVNTPELSLYKKAGVQYSLKKNEIENGYIVFNSNYTKETSNTVIVSGLSEQTTYYYRPVYYALKGSTYYENERYDNVYGEVKTFVTTEAPPRLTMTISTAGIYGWTTYNTSSYNNCLKSNNNGVSNSTARSILSFTVDYATTLTFGYRVSSESGHDKMIIKVDNNTICDGISGSTTKSSNSISLVKGDHTITLEYSKDNSGNRNDDCGYIYNIAVNGELLSNDDFK